MNPEEEFFIRELTRNLDEQINSVRRELDNLKKVGFLKTKSKNRKKYYAINQDFVILEELRSIFAKTVAEEQSLAKDLKEMGEIKLLILSGVFINEPTESIDMLLVGEIDKEKLAKYLNDDLKTERPVKFTILSESDYEYRLNCKDKFIADLLNDPENQILIKKL